MDPKAVAAVKCILKSNIISELRLTSADVSSRGVREGRRSVCVTNSFALVPD